MQHITQVLKRIGRVPPPKDIDSSSQMETLVSPMNESGMEIKRVYRLWFRICPML